MSVWEDFARYLSGALGEEFSLVSHNSLTEEQEAAIIEDYDLVFQNPETAQLLYSKGYTPIGRLNEQWDAVCYFSQKKLEKDKKFYKVGVIPIRVIYSTLIELEQIGLDINQIDFIPFKNLEDIHSAVINGEIDIGITRKDTYLKLSQDFLASTEIIHEFSMGIFHTFMVKNAESKFNQRIKQVLFEMHKSEFGLDILKRLGSDKIIEVGYEFKFIERLNLLGDKISEFRNYKSIFNAIEKVSDVGVVIYQDTIKYANNYVKKLTGYYEDIMNIKLDKLVAPLYRKKGLEALENRLAGKFFDTTYDRLEIITKEGQIIDCMGFASTVIYKGKPSGIFIFIDIRRRIFLEKALKASSKISNLFVHSKDKRILIKEVGEIIYNILELDYIKVAISDEKKCSIEFEKGISVPSHFRLNEIEDKLYISEACDKNGNIKSLAFILPIYINNKAEVIIEIHTSRYIKFTNEIYMLVNKLRNDITVLVDRIEKYFQNEYLFSALDSSKDFCMILNEDFKIAYINDSVKKITGYSKSELIGKEPSIFKSGKLDRNFYENLHKKIINGEQFEGIFINKDKFGNLFYLDATAIPIQKEKEFKGIFFIGKNITNEKLLENEVNKAKYQDYLTGLLNYIGYKINISKLIGLNPENVSAIIICDIQNMSYINSEYGYEFGNEVLRSVSKILRKCVKERDIIARVAGDDFGIFASNIKEKENIIKILERIRERFKRKIEINGVEIVLNFKICVVVYPFDGENIDELLNKSALTLGKLKKSDNDVGFYNEKLTAEAEKSIYVCKLINDTFLYERFVLFYQPYFYANSLELAGFEALVRIKDSNGNIIYPNIFIDYLEQSIYINKFEHWLINKAGSIIGKLNVPIGINISAKNLNLEHLKNLLDDVSIEICSKLTIEITEREVNNNFLLLSTEFEKYKHRKNFKIAIDDFGTGYSSLVRLKQIPCDVIKIDISFVRDLFKSQKDTVFVQAILELASKFGYNTLAEGVENLEQFEYLKRNGCDILQGYLFSKPVDEDTLINTDWKKYSETLRENLKLGSIHNSVST
ncbi:EAL domain-containing protein [Deferribacteraceae bacterium V6Fe1]|nr:EAL domain-containing protein [Deferribacteraceae bacterium V6Fe1]